MTRTTRISRPLTPEQRARKQARFLAAYREIGIIKAACKAAKISRQTYYEWRDHDEAFRTQLPEAKEEANESLEMVADEQARGIWEPVVSMGKIVYEEVPDLDEEGNQKLDIHGQPQYKRGKMLMLRKRSPSVLITLLKATMPEKYKERMEYTGKDGGPIKVEHVDYSRFSDEELALLERLARRAKDGDR